MYPVMLSVEGRKCLVVGGGGVALRKVDGLLRERALVTVVSPEPAEAIEDLAARGELSLERRGYRRGEGGAYALVFAATDDREANRAVAADAEAAGRFVNVADDPELCTFHLPAQLQRGSLRVMVASGGEAPFVVSRMRRVLERRFGREWGPWLEAAAQFRRRVHARGASAVEEERAFDAFFGATVDEVGLTARVPTLTEVDGFLRLAGAPETPEAPAAAAKPGQRGARGFVSLVGAGPGDPGLLTVLGRRRLVSADAVVYDRLAATALPADLPPRTALHCVGKEAGNHPVPQEEINALLVRLGGEGMRVVRLKGGDPYVFGRGSEEAEALRAAGIPFEVVPGVTSGIAVPAYAGIPVTHRREAVRVTLLTAHEAVKDGESQVRWDLLARDPHATLVGYMGVTSLPKVTARLIEAGMDPSTPGALIERGTTSCQRVVRAPLHDLADAARRAGLGPPALFVIGPTARHAAHLDWFGTRPLSGERIAVPAEAGPLGVSLSAAGAEVVELPLPLTEAARVVLGAAPVTGVVLRHATEVDALDEERRGASWMSGAVAWCLSPAAERRAVERGWDLVRRVEPDGLIDRIAAGRRVEIAG